MRQRKLKHVSKNLMKQMGVITNVKKLDINNIYLELGSGKGQFITSLAIDNPNKTYVAMEKNINVCYRILEKKNELLLDNLIIILGDANDILSYFDEGSVKQIYLNFLDPWPKAKHHKRRLSYKTYLDKYAKLLNKDGIIQLRTDHLQLFNDSLSYLEEVFRVTNIDYNHQRTKYFTEYEIKKIENGNIYQMKASVL